MEQVSKRDVAGNNPYPIRKHSSPAASCSTAQLSPQLNNHGTGILPVSVLGKMEYVFSPRGSERWLSPRFCGGSQSGAGLRPANGNRDGCPTDGCPTLNARQP